MKIRENNVKVMLKDVPVGECFRDKDRIAIKTDEYVIDTADGKTECKIVYLNSGNIDYVSEMWMVESVDAEVVIR